MIGFRPPKDLYPENEPPKGRREAPDSVEYPFANQPFTPKERFKYTMVALKAALLIGACFLGGLALVIFILTRIWS